MDREFCKPRSYKSLSSSESVEQVESGSFETITVPNVILQTSQDIYVQLVESFRDLINELF